MEKRARVLLVMLMVSGYLVMAVAPPPSSSRPSSSSRFGKSPHSKFAEFLLNPKELKAVISSTFANMLKLVWTYPTTTKTGKPVLQFESGYMVETVFDGNKHGIEPYSIEVAPDGDLLILDSANSNILRITPPFSRYSKARLVAGSAEGQAGYVDGRPRDARLSHPKGIAVDDKGNVYVADTQNMAIRKIGDAGMTTIAGGKASKPGLVDGPTEDARFSNDFDVFYVGSTCSLLVVDRGNQAIREIQLNYNDCAYQYGSNFSAGVLLIGGAAFVGYLLALLQQGLLSALFSRKETEETPFKMKRPPGEMKASDRSPFIPAEGDQENMDAGFVSFGRFFVDILKSIVEMCGGLASIFTGGSARKQHKGLHPMRDRLIPEDEPLTPRRKKSVTFREPEVDTPSSPPPTDGSENGDVRPSKEYKNPFISPTQKHFYANDGLRSLRHQSSGSQTYYEGEYDSSKEVVFGAVQENKAAYKPVDIKPVDYGDPMYSRHNTRYRTGMGPFYNY